MAKHYYYEFVEKVRKTPASVIPVQAGIQHINDFVDFNSLDPGFRRGDEAFFNKLLDKLNSDEYTNTRFSCSGHWLDGIDFLYVLSAFFAHAALSLVAG